MRPGTEAEWEELVGPAPSEEVPPPPEVPEEYARVPRGKKIIRPVPKSVAPTSRERELHELSHCVKGSATNDAHGKLKNRAWRESEPVLGGNFCFLGQRKENGTAPVFVLWDRKSRVTFAHVTQGKSASTASSSQRRSRQTSQRSGTSGSS